MARLSTLLRSAVMGRYAVPAFNVYSLESIRASLEAGLTTGAAVIAALGERYFVNIRPGAARAVLDSLLNAGPTDRPPVALHLDHASSPESCLEAIEAGFESVMIDGSAEPFQENVRLTKTVADLAHQRGVEVEAELGGLAAGEGSHEFQVGEEELTDPEQAQAFVDATGVDALAVSVGTVHGMYKGQPHLDLARLSGIHSAVGVPLVLHGGSGLPREVIEAAIERGIAKININTEISLAAVRRIREGISVRSSVHLSELGLMVEDAMRGVMVEYIHRMNASGRYTVQRRP
jgi:fructose-bisphosphate aldolase class II